MRKYKIRFITLITAFALVLGAAIGTVIPTVGAFAADYTPTGVFSAGTGGTVASSEAGDSGESYVQFELSDGGAVYYRHDTALKWYSAVEDAIGAEYFSLVFAFPAVNFETFTVSFESAQENINKDGTTKNAIVFTAEEDGTVSAACKYADEDAGEKTAVDVSGDVTLAFTGDENGTFAVAVNGTAVGSFENIGGYFLEYLSSSSDTPRVPVTFAAELPEGGTANQLVVIKEFNNQSMKLTDGKIVDDTAPVLVVNEKVNSFPLGHKFSLSYEAVDVCDESVSVTREYYMYAAPADGEEAKEPSYSTLSTSTYFMPQNDDGTTEGVSVRFSLDDGRGLSDDEKEYVYLSWYVDPAKIVTYGDTDYIPVVRDAQGPAYYSCVTVTEEDGVKQSVLNEEADAVKAYAEEVAKASENLNAGSGAYFYLPSLRGLINDDNTDYNNLKFTVYYKTQFSSTSQSETSLKYNALKFEIDDEAQYSFRVVATDKLGNSMQVYEDGQLVSVTSSNVWTLDCIPQFSFSAKSKGATIEKPGEQSLGYRDSIYNASDFDIVAIEGYEVEYKLYFFDQEEYLKTNTSMPTYSDMVEVPETYVDYLSLIREYDSSVEEDDAAWDKTDNDYEWNATDLTFRPQKSGFYFIEAVVLDKVYPGDSAVAYQVIEVRNPIDEIAGETYWLQNNIAAVVLFSISGVLAIAIIVLFLVKPSEKKVAEVDTKELKGQKKDKK